MQDDRKQLIVDTQRAQQPTKVHQLIASKKDAEHQHRAYNGDMLADKMMTWLDEKMSKEADYVPQYMAKCLLTNMARAAVLNMSQGRFQELITERKYPFFPSDSPSFL